MYRLLNSAIMLAPGVYHLQRISESMFATLVLAAAQSGQMKSYIGYQQTAEIVSRLAGVEIPTSREAAVVENGDVLLICKLAYRVQDPGTKGQPVPENFEFFRCQYSSG